MNKKYFNFLGKFSLTQILTLITAIATLITAIVTFNMVEEMQLQRLINNKPILKINIKNNNTSRIIVKEVANKREFAWVRGEGSKFNNLSLINVGNGAALDIKMHWETDSKKINQYLRKKYKVIIPDQLKGDNINVLLNQDKSIHEFSTPDIYIKAFEQFIEKNYLTKVKKRDRDTLYAYDKDKFLDTFLVLRYKDINGNSYNPKFKINIQLKYITSNKNSLNLELETKYLLEEIKEKK